MEQLDLCVENYNLDELLQVFNLTRDFGEQDLKNAKRIVLKMHPDKCGLDSKYFYFIQKHTRLYMRFGASVPSQKKGH